MFGPVNTPKPAVLVEYDCHGQRASKRFTDAYAARRFYVQKQKLGKHPKVKGV